MAATSDIKIVLTAEDEASSVIGKVTGTIDDMSKSLTTIGVAMVAFGAAIDGAFAEMANQAAESQTAQLRLGAVLQATGQQTGVTAGMATKLAESLSKVTAFSKDNIVSAEAVLGTYTNIGQVAFPKALSAAMDLSAVFGGDLQSAVETVGKALNDPLNGMTMLQRSTKAFTDEQINMIQSLYEGGHGLEAQSEILSILNSKYGGVADAVGKGLGGAMEQLSNAQQELSDSIMESVLPALEGIIEAVTNIVEGIKNWVDNNQELTAFIVAASIAIATMVGLIGTLILGVLAVTVVIVALTAASIALNISLIALLGPIGLVIALIGVVAGGVAWYSIQSQEANAKTQALTTSMTSGTKATQEFGTMSQQTADQMQSLADKVEAARQKVQDLQTQMNETIQQGIATQQSDKQNQADAIVAQQKKVADISKSISADTLEYQKQLNSGASADTLTTLQNKIIAEHNSYNQESAALSRYNVVALGITTQYNEAVRRSNETQFERDMEDMLAKQQADAADTIKKYQKLQVDLKNAQEAYNKSLKADQEFTSALKVDQDQQAQDVIAANNLKIISYNQVAAAMHNTMAGSTSATAISPYYNMGPPLAPKLNLSALPGRASGGPVASGMSYIVGENGPEVFSPSNSGRIIPNGGSSGGVQVVVDLRGSFGVSEAVAGKIGDAIINRFRRGIRV